MKNIALLLIFLSVFGCKPATDETTQFEPTIEDMKFALQMQMWTIQKPSDGSKMVLRLDYEGEDKFFSSVSGKPGEVVKLMIRSTADPEQVHIVMKTPSGGSFGVKRHDIFNEGRSWVNTTKICGIGDTLISGMEIDGKPIFRLYLGAKDD